ncbi:MAG: DUF4417 domain-containing protein [Treponema sp.]|nr:DUF4417 domain-containing protein [Treponema sp.]
MKKIIPQREKTARRNCHDIWWNAFMVQGARFDKKYDIPDCPTTAKDKPKTIRTYSEAKSIHKKKLAKGEKNYFVDAYVCFYEDDQNFDGTGGIWFRWKYALRILPHFAGIITPDFSTNRDFPYFLRGWNTYRMRAFGYWYGKLGYHVINNVRWNTKESWKWCFLGIPQNSIVCVGTVASNLKNVGHRPYFEEGLREMVRVLTPKTIIVYGSARYPIFDEIREMGIEVIPFISRTNAAFKAKRGEQK